MDELVHHCLRELAFDGDLGCNVSRLKDFVVGFYASQDGHSQLVDDAFCAFVWSVIVQQPSVRVGTPPPGLISEVCIAPQTSAKRKAAEKGEQITESIPPSLALVEDAPNRHLEDLLREYGDNLRIAVDSETSFAAITGSHIRPSKLSPMVYSALQLITRGREDGITTVELGRKTGYDQKTCFYLIKQLVELSLVIKARRGGVGNHTCIHRYFVERSPLWQQIQEEARDGEVITAGDCAKPCDLAEDATDQDGLSQILFDPIDSRHLSSLPLVKNRITKLLKASRNHIHRSNNLLMTIGFVHPTKTDRRFFRTRLRELIQQGVIERVLVPSSKALDRTIKCVRLVTPDNQLPEGSVIVGQDMEEDEKEPSLADDTLGHNEVKTNLTIYKQVSNMLEDAGPSGLTLNEICVALDNFDKRTIELLLTRASNSRPPAHLSDLGTVDLMETYGRERRHRYFTLAAYKCVLVSEQLQAASIIDVDLSRVGDFSAFEPKHFYTTTRMLHSYQDSLKDAATTKGKKRKRDEEASDGEESEPLPRPKRGRPRKNLGSTGASTTIPKKRGRPRKTAFTKDGKLEGANNESTHCPSKRVETFAPNMHHHSIIKPAGGDTTRPSGHQMLQRAGLECNSLEPVPQAELTTAGQEFLQTPSRHVIAGEKHEEAAPPSSRPSKRNRVNSGGKSRSSINISSLRRENELLKVIESMGGIVNMHSKDIFDAHTALLDTMSQAKEPTSAPAGTRLDKRTAESTLTSLENRGRIKMLKTSLAIPSGISRPACLVYLLDTSQEKVNAFLHQLSQNVSSATTGSAKDEDARSEPISSAPGHVTCPGHLSVSEEEKNSRGPERRRQKVKRRRKAKEAKSTEAKLALRKKAEETRAQREQDWDGLLYRIHPDPIKGTLAVRIRAVRGRFMQSSTTKDQLRWETEIQGAIKETRLVSEKITLQSMANSDLGMHGGPAGPPPVVLNPPEKPIESLIDQQGPPITQTISVKKGKAKEESEASRRPRFHWTREFDELARDASAIIRARCWHSKLDLSALDQVFPAVPRNSVRQRTTHLRDNSAEDLYMRRLEDQWHTVWLQYRGTTHLPDEDPGSPSNFNLIKHVEFLRNHVDKNALRVGFMERETPSKLVTSVEELYRLYEVKEDAISAPPWDYMWSTTVEEGREKQFRSQAFTKELDCMRNGARDEKVQLAEEALKMVFGTPSDLYDPDTAARLLHSVGDQPVSVATSSLLHQGVLSKLVRDPKKPKPGRMLKVSDVYVVIFHPSGQAVDKWLYSNLNSIGGAFPRDLFQDAISLEEVVVERVVDEMEWPLISSEGDVAALLLLVSEDQVNFTADLSHSQAARQKIDWNSKKADDEDIETDIRLRFFRTSVADPGEHQNQGYESPISEPDSKTFGQESHGISVDGKEAACTLKTEIGLINCSACINAAFEAFASGLIDSDRGLARRIIDDVRSRREAGLSKAVCVGLEAGLERHILWLVHRMTLTSPPILFWTYFNVPIVVAGDYCSAWSVVVSDEPLVLISPRRWLDLRGYRLDGPWGAAQQAVVGFIFLHPGISQAELRWRLRAVYDRQEVIDILTSLEEEDVLECRVEECMAPIQSLPGWLKTLNDEETIFWFIAKNHRWYQI